MTSLNSTSVNPASKNEVNTQGNQIFFMAQPRPGNPVLQLHGNSQFYQLKTQGNTFQPGAIILKQSQNGQIQALSSAIHPNQGNIQINASNKGTPAIRQLNSGGGNALIYAVPSSSIQNNQANMQSSTATMKKIKTPFNLQTQLGSLVYQPNSNASYLPISMTGTKQPGNQNTNTSFVPYILNSNGQPTLLSVSKVNQMGNMTFGTTVRQPKPVQTNERMPSNPGPVPHPACGSNCEGGGCPKKNQTLCTCPSSLHGSNSEENHCGENVHLTETQEKKAKPSADEGQSHVNYLVTLFQALQNSGVRKESFVTAFQNLGLSDNMHCDSSHEIVLKNLLNEISLLKEETNSLRSDQENVQKNFEKDMKILNYKLIHKVKQAQIHARNKVMCPLLEPQIQQVRADRLRLDRISSEFQGQRMNAVGQLSDLEGVLEEIVEEMLKGRCKLNQEFVTNLENRLKTTTNTILQCSDRLPSLDHMHTRQLEIEASANDYEKQSMERQIRQLEEIKEKCKKLNETINTFKKLVDMQANGGLNVRKERKISIVQNHLANSKKDSNQDRSKLLASIQLIQPNSEERIRKIELQEALRERRRRILSEIPTLTPNDTSRTATFLSNQTKLTSSNQDQEIDQTSNSNVSDNDSSSAEEDENYEAPKNTEKRFINAAMNAVTNTANVVPILRDRVKANHQKRSNRVMFSTRVQCNKKGLDLRLNCINEDEELLNMEKIPPTDFHEGGGCKEKEHERDPCSSPLTKDSNNQSYSIKEASDDLLPSPLNSFGPLFSLIPFMPFLV